MPEPSGSAQKLTAEILERMAVLVRGIRRNFPTAVDALDVTMRQCRAIMFLADGPASMSKLAASIEASLPATTGLVERLVQRDMVRRHPDPHDRRLVICELTRKGHEVIDALQEGDRVVFGALFARLSVAELQTVLDAVLILSQQLGPAPDAAPAEAAALPGSAS
jgi:DNA-binding MarR family transcriptional regulator